MVSPILPPNNSIVSQKSLLPSIASVAQESMESIRLSLAHLTVTERRDWANSRNEKGMTPLAVAVENSTPANSKLEMIKFLIVECKADPNIGDNDNWTPLYRASTGTKPEEFKFLLEHKASPAIANKDASLPIHRLVDRGSAEGVQIILSKGADVNAVNCFGTPLAYAAKNGNVPLAKILMQAGADPNLVLDPIVFTPLELAENNRKDEMKSFLESVGATKKLPDDSKVHTSISKLAQEKDEKAILQSFKHGEKDEFGRTVAHYCAHLGKVDLLKSMNDHSIDIPDSKGRIPLHYAVIRGQNETVTFLTSEEAKCDLTSKDQQGYTPLLWACQYNRTTAARNMLERAKTLKNLNVLLDSTDNFGWKPIHKAAQVGNVDLLRMFVEDYQVNHTQQTTNGRSPLDLANTTNSKDAVTYLTSIRTPLNPGMNKV